MPTLNSHTHCQVVQANTQPNLAKSVSVPTAQKADNQDKKNTEPITRYCQKRG